LSRRHSNSQINVISSPYDEQPMPTPRSSDTLNYGGYPSRSSLDSQTSSTSFDDIRLTAIPSPGHDPERVPSRYEDSPLKRSGTALISVSRKIRRVSVRVVNFAAADRPVRLEDDEIRGEDGESPVENNPELPKATISPTPLGPLRGRTLGFLHPNNTLRLTMYKFLIYKYVSKVTPLSALLTDEQMDGTHYSVVDHSEHACPHNTIRIKHFLR
jgi:hypothetical protein